MNLYLIYMWGDVEPELYGPFVSEDARMATAVKMRALDPDKKNGIFKLDCLGDPTVEPFAGGDLEQEDSPYNDGPYDAPVRDLLSRLEAAGFELKWVDDGGDVSHNNFLHHITGVDESNLGIEKDGVAMWLFLVLGNGKEEIVSDYSYRGIFSPVQNEMDAVIDKFYDHWLDK